MWLLMTMLDIVGNWGGGNKRRGQTVPIQAGNGSGDRRYEHKWKSELEFIWRYIGKHFKNLIGDEELRLFPFNF